MLLLTNHIGYERLGPKKAIIQTEQPHLSSYTAQLICATSEQTVATFAVEEQGKVANWHQGYFYLIDFSSFTDSGDYFLQVEDSRSSYFTVGEHILLNQTLSDVIHYFKSQRCGGVFDQQDRQVPVLNANQTVDVHGGWYDASGDVSKYLSHLSYANYLNPQQTPMVVWNILKGLSLLEGSEDIAAFTRTRLIEEALFGADFLVRMQNEKGFFYMTVFDKWSKDTAQREICAYETQLGHKFDDYQAGFRQGGGVAIAALAAASRLGVHGEYDQQKYRNAAENGYWHLKEHNTQYLNDGEENIIDEYCALLASVELFKATKETRYLEESRLWAQRLVARQMSDEQIQHFWSANQDGSRPYFHAAEAGLPVIALCEYLAIEDDSVQTESVKRIVNRACEFEIKISSKVTNPFGYPRQYVKGVNESKRDAFFVAHNNESGYWWQGENARLGSLATMAYLAQPHIASQEIQQQLSVFAQDALNWIVGLNPYDMCMLDGHGRNNPDYLPQYGFFNAKGGVCNGITGGFEDEEDIAFNPPTQKDDMLQNWRWGEQWIPHGAWYLLAIMSQAQHISQLATSKNIKEQ
ncbi:TPA: glycoside hydrolase family 9 protein [Vibrio parahaemolyticus]|uniref:Glycoside hydrolase family 9 protein n=1 Tax=Vibrio parahaemolyticus TaxID=670 RepID=A0AA46UL37_VIBPH|nr:glycoside hydrolase family 9 protein [Vibrio parahaemolyticus]EIC5075833.1 glycoside hydrolase family 9 protein [Vibrio parahaemolyticus]EXJ49802.1 endoglucanase-related protein [Vibrio parahaemolyticus VPTS-2010_2]MCC3848933.1 glycoside hydrolase family 9 protein [Vibrio parahaemolyticus]UYV26986.1 glycoside hydrolase family 9 protein [Vibrio parahaemolyticus]HBC3929485.1 glycoside hydrolase family 9 protein [Vibrio parahaemolyticus]